MSSMGMFNILAVPLGFAMELLYRLINNYGWTIIIFTFLVRILMFPLSLGQQKSTARMSAFQPMIQDIQKKWANDKNRQNAEMQKFYEENNIKMSAGCAPMIVNMLVLFGIIAVIQAPLTYILQLSTDEVNTGIAIVQYYDPSSEIGAGGYTQQSILIGEIKEDRAKFETDVEIPYVDGAPYVLQSGERYENGQILGENDKVSQEEATLKASSLDSEALDAVEEFRFQFMGLNLAQAPNLSDWVTLIMPILSVLTMVLSQLLMMKLSPSSQGRGQMLVMTVVFGVMFGFFAFRVPAGFSLYYTVSNIVMTLQQVVLRKIYNPAKIREDVEKEIEERKAAKKSKKKVVVVEEADGQLIDKEISESDLNRLRLEKARMLDAKRYSEDAEEEKAASDKAEKVRQLDEKKYGASATAKKDDQDVAAEDDTLVLSAPAVEDAPAEDVPADTEDDAEKPAAAPEKDEGEPKTAKPPEQNEYKPGRRKRARQSREKDKEDSASLEQDQQQGE